MKQLQKVIEQLTAIIELLAAKPQDQDTAAIKEQLQEAQIDLLKASISIIGGDDSGNKDAAS